MCFQTVTHVPEQVLPISPVYTPVEGGGKRYEIGWPTSAAVPDFQIGTEFPRQGEGASGVTPAAFFAGGATLAALSGQYPKILVGSGARKRGGPALSGSP